MLNVLPGFDIVLIGDPRKTEQIINGFDCLKSFFDRR